MTFNELCSVARSYSDPDVPLEVIEERCRRLVAESKAENAMYDNTVRAYEELVIGMVADTLMTTDGGEFPGLRTNDGKVSE